MNRRIKQVWLLAILSSFLLIGLQTYWLYNSVTYSMGEMGKKNAEKAEQAIIAYLTNIGAAVKEKSHIGYVVSAYFSDFKGPCTTVCSPLDTDTIIGGVVCRKPGFGNVMEKRDTFDLRETDSNNSFDCLNTYTTYQLTHFDKAHFDRFINRKLGNDFIEYRLSNGRVAPVAVEHMFLFFQVLQYVRLQVGAGTHIHDLEDRGECVVVLQGLLAREQVAQSLEQLLQSQVGSDAFVKRVFVQDHAVDFLGTCSMLLAVAS